MMKVAVIINGISRRKENFYHKILPVLSEELDVTVFETQYSGHAVELAIDATRQKFNCILAAGGDGTLNQVINGVLQKTDHSFSPAVGIIPLGTGNDFARIFGIKADGEQIKNLIKQNDPRPTDAGKIISADEKGSPKTSYFINVCSLGMGPQVVKRLATSSRSLGPLLTYLKAIAQTFFTHKAEPISIKTDQWQWEGNIRVFAVANGQSFGNKMFIAPNAAVDDGLFSTFTAGDLPLIKFLWCLQRIKLKKMVIDPLIVYNQCTSIEFSSNHPMAMEADGELAGWLPINVEMLPGRVKFLR